MKAWYFAPPNNRLGYGDNRKIEVGHTHTVSCSPKICKQGLHGSVLILDALQYAKSSILYQVNITGSIDKGHNKIAGKRRTYIKRYDIEQILWEFAREQALINIEKIKPYTNEFNLIFRWLQTGDETIRTAAYSAAGSATRSAARSAAESAAWAAAWSAAWSAAESAAESAAWSAAWAAAWSAAWSAAESATWASARSAAYSAANDMLTQMIERV